MQNLNETFVKEKTPEGTQVWVEKINNTFEKKLKSAIVVDKSLSI